MRSKLLAFGLISIGIGMAGAQLLQSTLGPQARRQNERIPSSMFGAQGSDAPKFEASTPKDESEGR
jgi:hypothetical protein